MILLHFIVNDITNSYVRFLLKTYAEILYDGKRNCNVIHCNKIKVCVWDTQEWRKRWNLG